MPDDGAADPQHSHPARTGDDRRLKDNLDADTRKQIGRKGGAAVSRDRSHMAEIGRRGGQAVARNAQHMADIGRRGGAAVSRDRAHMAAIGRRGGAARGAHKMGASQGAPMNPAQGLPSESAAQAPGTSAGSSNRLTQPAPPPKGEEVAVGQASAVEDEE